MSKSKEEQPSGRSIPGIIVWLVLGLTGIVYLLNPTVGLLEAIPDNVPVFGNLDEATATILVLAALKYLTGIDLTGRGPKLLRGKHRD